MMPMPGLHDPNCWLVAGVAVIAGLLLLRSNRYYARQRRESASSSPFPPRDDLASRGEEPEDMDHWEVQMHDTARDLSAQLDSKLSMLQALVAEADRAAARLEAALAHAAEPAPPVGPASPGRAAGADSPPRPAEFVPRMNQQARSLQHGEPVPRGTAAPIAAPRDRHQEEIYTLSDYGYEPAEIARRVNRPIGEVELILSLRGRG
jgi:hypothetical protein